MTAFDSIRLFAKAKEYTDRALNEHRESLMFPFWLSLALELLAKSSLAFKSPQLLADYTNGDATNLLYSLGYPTSQKPKSIKLNEVFNRLTKIDIGFTKEEYQNAISIMDQRNCELHSGDRGFLEYNTSKWLSDYYRIIKILLNAQSKGLVDLLGESESKAAETMLMTDDVQTKKKVLDRIGYFKKAFNELPQDVKNTELSTAISENRKFLHKSKIVNCPSCGSKSILSGDLISYSEAKIEDGNIKQERRYLPTSFLCNACRLTFNSYLQIKHTDFASQFVLEEYLDQIEYFGIDLEEHVDIENLVQERIRQMAEDQYYEDRASEASCHERNGK